MSDTATAPVVEAPVAASTEAVVDVTPSVPSHVQDAQKVESFADRMARARSKFEGKGEPLDKPVVEKVEAKPEPAAAKEEPAPEPEKPAEKLTAKEEAAHARALAALRKAEAENLRLKSEAKSAAEKLAAELAAERNARTALETQFKSFEKNPAAALKAAGMTAEEFMRGVANGTIKPPAPEDELREQVASKLSPLEQQLAEMRAKLEERERAEAQRAQEAQQAEARERDLGVVKQLVTEADYPITAALGAYDVVLNACYQSGSQDVAGKAAEFEAHQVSLLENLFNPKVLAALEKRSPKIREMVSSLRSNPSSKTAVSGGSPRVAAARDVVSAPTTPRELPKSDAERMARAKARLSGAQ